MSLEQALWNRTPREVWFRVGDYLSHKEFGRLALSSRTLFFNRDLHKEYQARKNLQVHIDARRKHHEKLKKENFSLFDVALYLYDLLEKNEYKTSAEIQALCEKVVSHINATGTYVWAKIPKENIAEEGGEIEKDKWPQKLAVTLNQCRNAHQDFVGNKFKTFILSTINAKLFCDIFENVKVLQHEEPIHSRGMFFSRWFMDALVLATGAAGMMLFPIFGQAIPWSPTIWVTGFAVSSVVFAGSMGLFFEKKCKVVSRCLAKCKRKPEENEPGDDLEAQREQQLLLRTKPVDTFIEEDNDVTPEQNQDAVHENYQGANMFLLVDGEQRVLSVNDALPMHEERRLGG